MASFFANKGRELAFVCVLKRKEKKGLRYQQGVWRGTRQSQSLMSNLTH